MDYSNLTDQQLVRLLKKDDELAFHFIYKSYWKDCFLTAHRKLNSKSLAEEATQNIFLSLWERRTEVEIQNLQAYIRTSVKYQVLNLIRQKISVEKHSLNLASQQPNNNIEEVVFYNELETALQKAMQDLPQKTSKIYQLSRFECLPGKEIAKKMNLSEKSVEYHITKALKYLRIELKDYLTTSIGIVFLSNFF